MGLRECFIKFDFDQRQTQEEPATGTIADLMEVEVDAEAGEVIKLDMFCTAIFTQPENQEEPPPFFQQASLIGILSGTEVSQVVAAETIEISQDAELQEYTVNMNITWMVDVTEPGTQIYNFLVIALSRPSSLIKLFGPRGINLMAFRRALE